MTGVAGYPTTTTSLASDFTNPTEAVALGGDCLLDQSAKSADIARAWASEETLYSASVAGKPTAIDVQNGVAFVVSDASPTFAAVTPANSTTISDDAIYNDVDVARDVATGRTYAYVAAASSTNQLRVLDVTFPSNLQIVASASLSGVSATSSYPQAWKVAYYGQKVYIATRCNSGVCASPLSDNPEFHVFNVSNPLVPSEVGSAIITSSAYDLLVRDQYSATKAGVRRFAYLATGTDTKELRILDVTDPVNIKPVTTVDLDAAYPCVLSDAPSATSLAFSGTMLYIGREYSPSCASVPTLYALDISDPYKNVVIKNAAQTAASVIGMRLLGAFLFVQTSPIASITGNATPGTGLLDIDHDYDIDRDYLYATANRKGEAIQVWNVSDPATLSKVSDYSIDDSSILPGSQPSSLQVVYNPRTTIAQQ